MTTMTINAGYTTFTIDTVKNKSVTVTREGHPPNTFLIGDAAEYDSWNLSYWGHIVSITDKTVTIDPRYGDRKRRLSLVNFAWRNYNFDLDETVRQNSDTMNYI